MADPYQPKFLINIKQNYVTDPNGIFIFSPSGDNVYKGAKTWVKLEWPPNTDLLLTGYNIYFSTFPLVKHKVNTTGLITDNKFEFALPLYPSNIVFYFWITAIINGVEVMLNDLDDKGTPIGQTAFTTAEAETFDFNNIEPNEQFFETDNIFEDFALILKRVRDDEKMAVQMLGVKCDVYLRKWGANAPYGIPCTCVEDKTDPDFMGSAQCPLCFGTGILSGYYPPMEMYIRFNATPSADFKGSIRGLTVDQTYNAWTIIPPFLREKDLVVRKIDGKRWEIKACQESFFRGAPLRQLFNLDLIMPNDIKQLVSLDNINKALSTLNDPRFEINNRTDF